MNQRVAMKAVIVKGDKVLLLREAATYGEGTNRGRYHLPGGRVEMGERFDAALHREVMEETGLTIVVKRPIYVDEWRPTIKGVETQIIGVFFICESTTHEVRLSTEHDDYRWVDAKSWRKYDVMDPENVLLELYFKSS